MAVNAFLPSSDPGLWWRDAPEIERAVTAFARSGDSGLIVTPSPVANRHRKLIAALAARHGLPAVYGTRQYVAAGGLISYGPDMIEQYRRAAGYVGSEALAHRRRHVFSW
jgi:putative ABC transport system substrate-binding protein